MYRTTDTGFYNHPKIKKLPFPAKALAHYLFTNRYTHVSGIYFLKKSDVIDDLGLNSREFDKIFQILLENQFCHYDEERQVIWVVSMYKRQPGCRNPKILKCVDAHLPTLYNSPLIPLFLEKYQPYGIAYRYPINNLSIGIPSGERTEEETGTGPPPTPLVGGSRKPVSRKTPEDSKRIAEEAMDRLDLGPFREKYPWLNHEAEFSAFKDHHLARPNNYHGNKRIEDWNRAYHNWCRPPWKKENAIKAGWQWEETRIILDGKKAREDRLRRLESRNKPLPDEVPA
jgi:hypothetical protein